MTARRARRTPKGRKPAASVARRGARKVAATPSETLPLVAGAAVRHPDECPCFDAGEVLKVRACGAVVVDWIDYVEEYGPEDASRLRVDAVGAVCDWHAPGWIGSGFLEVERAEIDLRFASDPDAVRRWRSPHGKGGA